ncbi:MAG: PA14 domain-containing protein [Methanoregula sp.]|nr:PA14 domain-containing protein [Methanoregula sp.]
MPKDEDAISESISIILIIFLMLVVAMIVYLMLFGYAGLVEKSAFIALRGTAYNTSSGAASLAIFHMQGERVSLNSSLGLGITPVQFTLKTPFNTTEKVYLSPVITDTAWQSGDTAYIYQDGGGFWVTKNITRRVAQSGTLGPLVDLQRGVWTVQVIDTRAKVLIATIPIAVGGTGAAGIQYSPGLLGTYYNTQSWTSPLVTKITSQIRFADTSSGWASDVSNWPVGYIGKADSFSVKYEGLLKIDTEDDYTFYLTSDDGSYLDIDGSQIINNGGLHSPQMRQATVHLLPGFHPITARMFENTGGAVVWLEYSAPSVGARQIVTKLYHIVSTPPEADFTAVPRAGTAPLVVQFTDASVGAQSWSWDFGDGLPGSTARNPAHTYTSGGSFNVTLVTTNSFGSTISRKDNYITAGAFVPGLPAFYYRNQTWTSPASARTDTRIRFADPAGAGAGYPSDETGWPNSMVGRQEDFSVLWDGYLRVTDDNTYTFYLTSDDGSWLWIDEALVVDNGGLHSPRTRTGSVRLTPGYHHVVVKMFENTGQAVAWLEYSSPALARQFVADLWHM